MLRRIFYQLEKKVDGQWEDWLGSYDIKNAESWKKECSKKHPGEYRIRRVYEEYAILIKDICAVRMGGNPNKDDKEVVALNRKAFNDYVSMLESYSAEVAIVNDHGNIVKRRYAFILTLEEDPMADGKERKWDYCNICATEKDADALIAELKAEEEESCKSEYLDDATKKRLLGRRYYKRTIKLIR